MASGSAPTNDDIRNAIPLGAASIRQSNVGATTASGEDTSVEPGYNAPTGKTLWYSYTAQSTGPVTINTNGSDFDTTLQAYALANPAAGPSYGNLVELASNDDNASGGNPLNIAFYASTVSFNATAGQTYYIQAGGRGDEVGAFDQGNLVVNASPVVCFVSGTRIRVMREGTAVDVAVENLHVGDRAVTASGALRPIVWIGYRTLEGTGPTLPHDQQPIHIRSGAFGLELPSRDLRLSPGHPVLMGADEGGVGGVLVPIMCLINGTSIVREPVRTVTYWHVELDSHDLLLAEGLPAESYYDMGSRPWFSGANDPLVDPNFVPAGAHGRCRPVAVDGPVVEAERVRLSGVFAASLDEACAWDEAKRFAWIVE